MIKILASFFKRIADSFPSLALKLKQAGMKETPPAFVKKTFFTSFYMTTGFSLFLAFIFSKTRLFLIIILAFLFPLIFVAVFFYFIKLPDAKIIKKRKTLDREVVYAARFLIVEMESGVLLYNAMANVAKSYKEIGKAFKDILHSIDFGTPVEDALNESIEYTPSYDFRRILWQIINALRTGSDVSEALKSVVEQITREQIIEIKAYAKKLNPLAMFYMIIAVILPSLGITMLIVLSSFISLQLSLAVLIGVAVLLGLLQFMFYVIIRSSRPAVSV
ncbi:type II secretion system F family protein [Candidatus Woesearchaeota archaeon]|nr:type II secretion system F family protein [Candidatus Woesearchaeota archaeon]